MVHFDDVMRMMVYHISLTSGAGSSILHDPPSCMLATRDSLEKEGLGLNAEAVVMNDAAARNDDKDTFMVNLVFGCWLW